MNYANARFSALAVLSLVFAMNAVGEEVFVLNRLKEVSSEPRISPPTNDADRQVLSKVASLNAQSVIPPSTVPGYRPTHSLNRTLRDYVTDIVFNGGTDKDLVTTLGFVPCSRSPLHRCAAVAGDPCAASTHESCEGMHLVVIVDIDNNFSFDRAIGGGYYLVENVKDIEDMLAVAP